MNIKKLNEEFTKVLNEEKTILTDSKAADLIKNKALELAKEYNSDVKDFRLLQDDKAYYLFDAYYHNGLFTGYDGYFRATYLEPKNRIELIYSDAGNSSTKIALDAPENLTIDEFAKIVVKSMPAVYSKFYKDAEAEAKSYSDYLKITNDYYS